MKSGGVVAALSPEDEEMISRRLDRARAEHVIERIRRHDGTLWASREPDNAATAAAEITRRLGWLDIADRMRSQLHDLAGFVETIRADGYTDAVLLGMGGSSLAPEVFWRSFH